MSTATQRSFQCPSCRGIIYIPHNLPPTSAPCPHCGNLITSPPIEHPFHASPEPEQHVAPPQHQQAPYSHPAQQAPISSAPVTRPNPAPVARPSATHVPLSPAPNGRLSSASAAADPEPEKSSVLGWILALILLAILCGGGWFAYKTFVPGPQQGKFDNGVSPKDPALAAAEYAREGWKKETAATLHKFLEAESPEEKASCVIGGMETLRRLELQYGKVIYDEVETPFDAFVPIPLGDEDNSRNIYLMTYDRPAQFAMSKFFRPLVPFEVQQGVTQLDPLTETMTHVSNFAMDPMKIQAFFKRTDKGMLLDWDIYLQTRMRTLQKFYDHAKPGDKGIFRVLIVEDVPLPSERNNDLRVYRIGDPAHTTDTFRVNVPATSPITKDLSKIHWRGAKSPTPNISTATLELTKSQLGVIVMQRFVCWEFEGLGGLSAAEAAASQQGNRDKTSPTGQPELPAPGLNE